MSNPDNPAPAGQTIHPLPVHVPRKEPFTAGMGAVGPLSALFAGMLLFGLFVYGASHTQTGEQAALADAKQQQQAQRQNPAGPETTGLSPQAQEQERMRGRETTGAAPVDQEQKEPSTAKTGVPPAR